MWATQVLYYCFCFVSLLKFAMDSFGIYIKKKKKKQQLYYQNVRSLPEHFAIGNVHSDNLPLGIIALIYAIQRIAGRFNCVFW